MEAILAPLVLPGSVPQPPLAGFCLALSLHTRYR